MWFPNGFDTILDVQAQRMAQSGLNFFIYNVDELYYPFCENKGADQLRSYCAFVFAYAKCWFCHDAAQMFKRFYLNLTYKFPVIDADTMLSVSRVHTNFTSLIVSSDSPVPRNRL